MSDNNLIEVTDPDILKQLNSSSLTEVTDPDILAQLNSASPPEKGFFAKVGESPLAAPLNIASGAAANAMGDIYGMVHGWANGNLKGDVNPMQQDSPDIKAVKEAAGATGLPAGYSDIGGRIASAWRNSTLPQFLGAAEENVMNSPTGNILGIGAAAGPKAIIGTLGTTGAIEGLENAGIPHEYTQGAMLLGSPLVAKYAPQISESMDTIGNKIRDNKLVRDIDGTKPSVKSEVPTANDIKENAIELGKNAETLGGGFKPELGDSIDSEIQSLKRTPILEGGKLSEDQVKLNNELSSLEGLGGEPLSIAQLGKVNDGLNDLRQKYITSDPSRARDINTVKYNIRSKMADPAYIDGSPLGVKAMLDSTNEFHRYFKMNDFENILNKAQFSDNPQTAIKNGFASLAKNETKLKSSGYTTEEIAAINKAAKTGISTNLVKLASSKGIDAVIGAILGSTGGGVAGGLVGGAAGAALAKGASQLAGKMQANRASGVAQAIMDSKGGIKSALPEDIANVLKRNQQQKANYAEDAINRENAGTNVYGEPLNTPKQPVLALSAPDRPFIKGIDGRLRPMNDAELENASNLRNSNRTDILNQYQDLKNTYLQTNKAALKEAGLFEEVKNTPIMDFLAKIQANEYPGDKSAMTKIFDQLEANRATDIAKTAPRKVTRKGDNLAENYNAKDLSFDEQTGTYYDPDTGITQIDGYPRGGLGGGAVKPNTPNTSLGDALADAVKNPVKPPLKVTVSKDPNIGSDGLPKVDLPSGVPLAEQVSQLKINPAVIDKPLSSPDIITRINQLGGISRGKDIVKENASRRGFSNKAKYSFESELKDAGIKYGGRKSKTLDDLRSLLQDEGFATSANPLETESDLIEAITNSKAGKKTYSSKGNGVDNKLDKMHSLDAEQDKSFKQSFIKDNEPDFSSKDIEDLSADELEKIFNLTHNKQMRIELNKAKDGGIKLKGGETLEQLRELNKDYIPFGN